MIREVVSDQGYLTFFTDMQNTTERVEEKNKRINTDMGQLHVQESVCDTVHSVG